MTKVGAYLRISDDRDGEQTATARQREDCERFAEGRGWHVQDVFEDVDLSAYKRSVKRPEFERMIAAVRAKEIDGVVCWHIDRLTRHRSPFARLMDACEDTGAFIATVTDGVERRAVHRGRPGRACSHVVSRRDPAPRTLAPAARRAG